MTRALRTRLAKLEARLSPSQDTAPAVVWCFRDEAGTLRSYADGEAVPTDPDRSAQGLPAVEIRELPLDEFRAICADLEERV